MKGKLLFVAGAAVGYVLGARAGRKRYEQIRSAAERVWETPGVQNQVEQVKDFAAQTVGDVPGALADGAKKAFSAVAGTRKNPPKSSSSSSSSTTSASSTTSKPAAKKSSSTATAKKPAAKKSAPKKSAPKKSTAAKSTTAKSSSDSE